MKKLLLFSIALFTLTAHLHAQSAPFNRYCLNTDRCCGGWYRPGVYLGGEFGYAWIQTPTSGGIKIISDTVTANKGRFAWGLFTGVSLSRIWDHFYLGFEAAYNDNGYSLLRFGEEVNQYKITSHDCSLSATFSGIFLSDFNGFFKIGAARVWENFHRYNRTELHAIHGALKEVSWAPAVGVGVGYSLLEWLNVSLLYRGLLSNSHNETQSRLSFTRNSHGTYCFHWHGVSTVHSLFGGLSVTF